MADKTYTGTVTVSTGSVSAVFNITFIVYQGADIQLTPSGADFSGSGTKSVTFTGVGLPALLASTHLDEGSGWLTPSAVSSTGMTVTVNAAGLAAGYYTGQVQITQSSGSPVQAGFDVTLTVAASPPSLSTLSPASATAGGSGFTLTVNGSGFLSGATVLWNSSSLTTIYVNTSQLTASVPASLISSHGTASVTATNPGAAASNALTFTINAPPAPTLSSLSPSSAVAAGPPFTLTVNGSGFVNGSTVLWNGSTVSTSYVGGSQLTASIPANLIGSQGSASVTATNPGSAPSNALTFTINPPASSITLTSYPKTIKMYASVKPRCDGAPIVVAAGTGAATLTLATSTGGSGSWLSASFSSPPAPSPPRPAPRSPRVFPSG